MDSLYNVRGSDTAHRTSKRYQQTRPYFTFRKHADDNGHKFNWSQTK